MRNKTSPEEFVRIWQQAESLEEVTQKTGYSNPAASARAGGYRRKGVALKRFSNARFGLDWKLLAKIAKEEAPK